MPYNLSSNAVNDEIWYFFFSFLFKYHYSLRSVYEGRSSSVLLPSSCGQWMSPKYSIAYCLELIVLSVKSVQIPHIKRWHVVPEKSKTKQGFYFFRSMIDLIEDHHNINK